MRLTTLLRDAGEELSPRMSNNRAKVKKAFDELIAKGVLRDYQERPIKQGRKIVEVEYTLQTGMGPYDGQTNAGFVSDQKRASHFRSKQLDALAKKP